MATLLNHPSEVAQQAGAGNPAIKILSLSHAYGDRQALKNVSLEVPRAQIFGLLGPNGSGKTTMFRILSTLMKPAAGRAEIMGVDAAASPHSVRRQIGVVFQAHSADIKLTVFENLMHQGHLYGLRGAGLRRRIAEMLERVALSDRAHDRVETLSGGMVRRVELAKGLLHRPSVLLLDEPTTGLDPGARLDVWTYLRSLAVEGTTVLVTTHLMEEADKCDSLAILSAGELVAVGTPEELKSQIGGDVVVIEARDIAQLAGSIRERFNVSGAVVEDRLRIELRDGHRFAASVMEAFGREVRAISISKPTLEDVFITRTGHRFWTKDQAGER